MRRLSPFYVLSTGAKVSNLKQRKRSRWQPPHAVRVMVACNGDGGLFEGRAEGLTFEARGESIDLELSGARAPRFSEFQGYIRIFRRRFKVLDCASCVGNWCWNSYTLYLDDAATLLNLALPLFSCTGASGDNACRLSDAIDANAARGELMIHLSMFGSARA